jgi:IS5 family transposase
MCGLLIVKHLRNLPDESVVDQCSENAYCKFFCGCQYFTPSPPCNATELVHLRHRIGEETVELIPQESIRVNDEDPLGKGDKTAFIDSTAQGNMPTASLPYNACMPLSLHHIRKE